MLEARSINAGYGKIQVLYNIDIVAHPKQITVIVGPNGSGKSTLLKTLAGYTTLYSGKILFKGKDISKLPPHKRARLGIAYMPQIGNVFSSLTVKENLIMAGLVLDKETFKIRLEEALRTYPIIKKFLHRKVRTLSGGERQMVAMAVAIIRRPEVVMFDEPSANLAPKLVSQVLNQIVELRDKLGVTIVLVEQNTKEALKIGDYAYLLVSGRVKFSGKAADLLNHPDFGKLYLGLSQSG